MKRAIPFLLFMVVLSGVSLAAENIVVKYISMEHVYLNAGSADGLAVGSRLNVLGANGTKAELEVVFVAAHSASCKVIGPLEQIQVGDRVVPQTPLVTDSIIVADTTTSPVPETAKSENTVSPVRPKRTASPITGNVSFVFYNWNDDTEPNLDFTQATTRLSLKARRLFGQEVTLSVRGRGRFDKRARNFSSGIEDNDWSNKVWEFSLSYDDPNSAFAASAGRILPRRVGAIGYLDGALIETRFSRALRFGLFGGASPDWMYDDPRLTLTRTGGYLSVSAGTPSTQYFEQAIGMVGEYHGGEVNREFLLLQGRYSRGGNLGLNHSAEIDVNRGWRKERAGKSLELSNLYLSTWFRLSDRLRVTLNYDNRTNYWTYESRSVVDSLFDDQLRQGARGQVDVTLPGQFYLSGSTGYRKRQGDPDPTWSYSGSLRKANAIVQGLSFFAHYAGFDGPTTRGANYSLRVNRTFSGRYTLGSALGNYTYDTDGLAGKRTNRWFELSGQADIGRHYWLGSQFQSESGDDLKGFRIQGELGYRF